MPSTNKTPQLGLNSWVEEDKPRREDFVQDNAILDDVISGHLADTVLHLTSQDRALLTEGVKCAGYSGSGLAEASITLDFEPKAVFVFLQGKPFSEYNAAGKYMVVNCGLVTPTGKTAGIRMNKNTVFFQQSQAAPSEGGAYFNLNKLYGQYSYLALR